MPNCKIPFIIADCVPGKEYVCMCVEEPNSTLHFNGVLSVPFDWRRPIQTFV